MAPRPCVRWPSASSEILRAFVFYFQFLVAIRTLPAATFSVHATRSPRVCRCPRARASTRTSTGARPKVTRRRASAFRVASPARMEQASRTFSHSRGELRHLGRRFRGGSRGGRGKRVRERGGRSGAAAGGACRVNAALATKEPDKESAITGTHFAPAAWFSLARSR